MAELTRERVLAFLADLTKLTKSHRIIMSGGGYDGEIDLEDMEEAVRSEWQRSQNAADFGYSCLYISAWMAQDRTGKRPIPGQATAIRWTTATERQDEACDDDWQTTEVLFA